MCRLELHIAVCFPHPPCCHTTTTCITISIKWGPSRSSHLHHAQCKKSYQSQSKQSQKQKRKGERKESMPAMQQKRHHRQSSALLAISSALLASAQERQHKIVNNKSRNSTCVLLFATACALLLFLGTAMENTTPEPTAANAYFYGSLGCE